MNHAELLARLKDFTPDETGISFTFTQRLAQENGWPGDYARRVIDEYKRFAFLFVVAGHPVSPSDAVDQAWHLHLTYTQSYWKDFCGVVLQKPMHHHPTKGGARESEKFRDWYAQTLASYRTFFGEAPPADIWPSAVAQGTPVEQRRVDLGRHWVIPKPRWTPGTRCAVAMALVLFLAGCQGVMFGNVPILDWQGPRFLTFYLIAAPLALLVAFQVRKSLRQPDREVRAEDLPKDIYVLAALAGGPVQVINTAVVSLFEQGALKISHDAKVVLIPAGEPPESAHPIERRLRQSLSELGDEMKIVRQRSREMVRPIIASLQEKRWLVSDEKVAAIRFIPFALALAVPAMGLMKICVGLARNKPVGYLVGLVIATIVLAGICFLRRPRRTLLGDRVLAAVQGAYQAERKLPMARGGVDDLLPASIALFGLSALDGTAHANLKKQLTPPPQASGGCGATSGCGSAGNGCGGAGGCGGGGCGGCGGS